MNNNDDLNSLTIYLLQVRNQMKIYHWQTTSYARHKATDSFLQKFEPLVDRLVEAIQGILDIRIKFSKMAWVGVNNCSEDDAKTFLTKFRNFLNDATKFKFNYPEITQIRDDMLEVVDVTLYLFTHAHTPYNHLTAIVAGIHQFLFRNGSTLVLVTSAKKHLGLLVFNSLGIGVELRNNLFFFCEDLIIKKNPTFAIRAVPFRPLCCFWFPLKENFFLNFKI